MKMEEKKAKKNIKDELIKEREEIKDYLKEDIETGKKEFKNTINSTIDKNGDHHISLGEIFGEMFSLKKDVATVEQITDTLVSGGHITGTNMCLLVLAIFIASIGLNVNSTAVIIGAMLISPLMGTIQATALGTATSDGELSVRSLMGFLAQVVISLCTSTLYFSIILIKSSASFSYPHWTIDRFTSMYSMPYCSGFSSTLNLHTDSNTRSPSLIIRPRFSATSINLPGGIRSPLASLILTSASAVEKPLPFTEYIMPLVSSI